MDEHKDKHWLLLSAVAAGFAWFIVVGPTTDPCARVRTEIRAATVRAHPIIGFFVYLDPDSGIDAEKAANGTPLTTGTCLATDFALTLGWRPQ